jgi:hypothetical protein
MSVSLLHKTTPVSGWHLTNPDALWAALAELVELGYTGNVSLVQQVSDTAWELTVTANDGTVTTATVGDWLVNDGDLKVLSAADFQTRYTTA